MEWAYGTHAYKEDGYYFMLGKESPVKSTIVAVVWLGSSFNRPLIS